MQGQYYSVRKDVVMGLYTMTFTFMLSSLPCLHTFWHAIPTSCYIFFCFLFLSTVVILGSESLRCTFMM